MRSDEHHAALADSVQPALSRAHERMAQPGPSPPPVTAITECLCRAGHKQRMPVIGAAVDAGALFQTHHDRIFRYVLRMVRNRAEAEDLTQEAFLRAYRGRDTLRHPEAVRGWLYRIATHVCLDHLRRRTPPFSMDSEQDATPIPSSVAPAPSGLDVTERKETSACVQRCLDFLPDSYRAVILLHEAHSLTAIEIAQLLGLKVTTVKMRLHRGRHMLQQIMECGCVVSNDSQGVPVCQPKS